MEGRIMLKFTYRLILVVLALAMSWSVGNKATAQAGSSIIVKINTFPGGASVKVDGKVIGNTSLNWDTPLTFNLKPGTHTFQFSLPGFVDKVETRTIDTTSTDVKVILEAGPDFIQLSVDPGGITWASNGQQVRFATSSGERKPLSTTTYDLDKKTWVKDTPLVDTVEDATLRSRLGAVSALYKSPSGRYIGYISGTSFLMIADISANRYLRTSIRASTSAYGPNSSLQLVWSPNETAIWVHWQGQAQLGEFVFLENGQAITVYVRIFRSEVDEEVYVDHVLAPPTEGKLALVIAGGNGKSYVPWLVDLQSMTGKPLPIDGIFDAGFAPSGKTICVVHKGGISRLSVDLKSVERVSTVVSARWGVHMVSLSPTLNYAIVGAGGTEAGSYWLYKMPNC
jgi:hypothetical protein